MTLPRPSNPDAERLILGAIMLDERLLDDIDVKPHHFYFDDHANLLRLMLSMRANGEAVDTVTIPARVSREEDHEGRFGGVAYVLDLPEHCVALSTVPGAAATVRADAARREVMRAAEEALEHAGRGIDDPSEVIRSLAGAIDLIDQPGGEANWVHLPDAMTESIDETDDYRTGERQPGIPSGLRDLDAQLGGGLSIGDLVILAARPSVGKTALGVQIAENVAVNREAVGVFSLEMSAPLLGRRILSAACHIDAGNLRRGAVTEDEIDKMRETVEDYRGDSLWIDDRSGLSLAQIKASARQLDRMARAAGHADGLRLVVIDYMQLMDIETSRGENRATAVGRVSTGLKALAKDMGVTVLALSQLSRKCESRPNKRPIASDLRDSGSIEQDADVIIMLYRAEMYRDPVTLSQFIRDKIEINVVKNRNGERGLVIAHWVGEETRVETMKPEYLDIWKREKDKG